MRCRNIKFEFFIHETLLECEPLARLLFIGLWCMADRKGRLQERLPRIRVQVMPYDECDLNSLLGQLEEKGFIIRYTANGMPCIQVVNFLRHQHPHFKEPPSRIPPPEGYFDEKPQRGKPSECPGNAQGNTEALTGQVPDKPSNNPADMRNADTLITESLISDSPARMPPHTIPKLIRLSYDAIPDEWAKWAHNELGWSAAIIQDVWISFRDYWQSRTGKSAQKSDWSATWRNWCRQQKIRNGGSNAITLNHTSQSARASKSERFKQALIDSTYQELSAE